MSPRLRLAKLAVQNELTGTAEMIATTAWTRRHDRRVYINTASLDHVQGPRRCRQALVR
jgi:hypothetical protein